MHLQERCEEDGRMSEDFLRMAKSKDYVVQCSTVIGWVTNENSEYRNSVSYRVVSKKEIN